MSDEALRRLERSAAYGGREDRFRYALELERRGRPAEATGFLAPWTLACAEAIAATADTLERPLRPAVQAEAAWLLATLGHDERAREIARAATLGARSGRDALERGWPRARAAAALARAGELGPARDELTAVLALVTPGASRDEDAHLLTRWFVALADALPGDGSSPGGAADPLAAAGFARLAALRPSRQGLVLEGAAAALVTLGLASEARALGLRLLDDALRSDLDAAYRALARVKKLGLVPDAELGGRILAAVEARAGDADDHVGPLIVLAGLRPLPRAPRVARDLATRLEAAGEPEAAASVRLAALALEAENPDRLVEADSEAADRLEAELEQAWGLVEEDPEDVFVHKALELVPALVEPGRAVELLDDAVARAELIPVAGHAEILATVFEAAARLPRTLDTEDAVERWAEAALAGARRTWPVLRAVAAALACVRELGAPASLVPFVERATTVAERALDLAIEAAAERGDVDASGPLACEVLIAAARASAVGGRRALAAPLVRRTLGAALRIPLARGGTTRAPIVTRSIVASTFDVAGDLVGDERAALATEILQVAGRLPGVVLRSHAVGAAVTTLMDELVAPAARLVTDDPALLAYRVWHGEHR